MKNFILFGLILAAIQTTSCATYSQAYSDQYYQDNNSQYQDNSNQNEEDISFRLLCPQGKFQQSKVPNLSHMYLQDGHEMIFKHFLDVLHFGATNMHSETLSFNPNEILKIFTQIKFGHQ